MPYPYTRYRSRNRTRINNRIPPLAAASFGPVSMKAGTQQITFDVPMDVTITTVPPGWTIAGVQVAAISWESSTVADFSPGPRDITVGDPWVFPATNILRTASGGPVAARSGVLLA